MTTCNTAPQIVLGMDFSGTAENAFDYAFAEAERRNADLHVLHVVDDLRTSIGGLGQEGIVLNLEQAARVAQDRLQAFVRQRLAALSGPDAATRAWRTVIHVRVGYPEDELVRIAAEVDADLVVVGTHGRRGVSKVLLGSVAERVLRLAHCPVVVVRQKDHPLERVAPEPPCPKCVARRVETGDAESWCAEHAQPRFVPHGAASYTQVIPTAADPFAFGR